MPLFPDHGWRGGAVPGGHRTDGLAMEKWLPVAVPGDFLSLSQPGPSQINRCHPKTMTPLSWSCSTPPDPSSLKTCLEEVETSRFSTATFSLGQLFLPGALSEVDWHNKTAPSSLGRAAPEESFSPSLPKCFHQDGKTQRAWGEILSQQPRPSEASPEAPLIPSQPAAPAVAAGTLRPPHQTFRASSGPPSTERTG